MRRLVAIVGFAVAMLEAKALAQDAPEPPPDPAASPGFATLDRGDASSRLGGEMSYLFFSNSPPGAMTTGLRFDVHGQYVDRSGFGGYAQLPISYLRERTAGMSGSTTVLADAEVGGLYVAHVHPNV